jgi:hypothetical protein
MIASRAGIETKSADCLAARIAPLDNERVDLDAILRSANHIESLALTTALKAFRGDHTATTQADAVPDLPPFLDRRRGHS